MSKKGEVVMVVGVRTSHKPVRAGGSEGGVGEVGGVEEVEVGDGGAGLGRSVVRREAVV